jgi:peptidoglycan/LPS O-acetylase OafA/YrhL
MGLKYLPEIDGLRAVAVLAVIAYHAGLGGAGFVGVDMFFVISGYLITSLLLNDIAATGRPDFIGFYARRIRRIFPAVIFIAIACVWAAYVLLPPAEMERVFRSAAAVLVFGANFYFQLTTGDYFDAPAGQMPLLHLWSLGVEEQFYLIWPLALAWIMQTRRPRLVVLVIAAASLVMAQLLIAWRQEWAFFQMPPRFWELATGGLIAMGPRRVMQPWVPTVGLIVSIAACFYPLPQFPGIGALPAVVGASMVCAAAHGGGNPGPARHFLRSRLMVGIGLISYSLYLWHWPLLVFYRTTSVGETSLQVRLLLCALAFPLAIASYRYIEQPFRRMRYEKARTVAFGATASITLSLSACAIGLQPDTPKAVDPFPLATQAQNDLPPRGCSYTWKESNVPKCPDPAGAKAAIWGDSMAYAWRPVMPTPHVDLSHDGCAPLLDWLPDQTHPADFICRDFEAAVVRHIGGQSTLVIVARWKLTGNQPQALRRTLEAVSAKVHHVVLIGPTPELRDTVPRCIRMRAEAQCTLSRDAFDQHAAPILARLRGAADGLKNVTVVDVTDYFCTATACPPVKQGIPLYWDSHHPTATATRRARKFGPLANALR